ncbi:phosphoenolpyruvate carboxykinase (GTP) [Curtobacterium sp. VKM Ac-1376]|uniref:phosphoenolpyruvate carboxykinase (GTP) n=1 Tax=Curtobacterium sp. VKM Ac-1376 TaxID=123312 RepID=UPI00188C9A88|nr:phosphoenolpyruvate carboxykinase (GTP) [Curtobacterium sp. VKM Ac-1376]MBF4616014.1 phosphoenolpyruvate carboxykinase (GTP) [Curtobacterium sp. VKM Ac-1376]
MSTLTTTPALHQHRYPPLPVPRLPDVPDGVWHHGVANRSLAEWVARIVRLARPDDVVWLTGADDEWERLTTGMVESGALLRLDPALRPDSFLARSDPDDVARVEDRTFVCSRTAREAGPTNNWWDPREAHNELDRRFAESMRGRTMYVVPYSMGPVGGAISQLGVQVTDSAYAALSLTVMARVGDDALAEIGPDTPWVAGVHSVGFPLRKGDGTRREDVPWPSNPVKYIAHFPEERAIWSYGSGYGGNALLSKKCFALRIASVLGRDGGWLAEHMLVLRLTSPDGRITHVAAAFPSACGKTNLAMLQPTLPGWRVETIGDDIAWLRPGADGRLWAINPEAGFFGVAPGTNEASNPVAVDTIRKHTIFTNVALTDDGDVWWEGRTPEPPAHLTDWRGQDWTPGAGRPAAHPNARFTVPVQQCRTLADSWAEPDGVPIDAIVFGGRRATNVPLVTEARDWTHGVFVGATVSSETTAAQEGALGVLRRDPFGMLPFVGYDMGDHWQHWLDVGARLGEHAPRIFQVNWFRKGDDGSFLWPGFGENVRVLAWIADRVHGAADAEETGLGLRPVAGALDLDGLTLGDDTLAALFAVDPESWLDECARTDEFFGQLGESVPPELHEHLAALRSRLWHDHEGTAPHPSASRTTVGTAVTRAA